MSDVEFSRPLRVEPLPRDGLEQSIEANAAERAALAKLNGLPAIERLAATLRVAKWGRGVRVEGELAAKLTQTCVVSLEPFETEIDALVDVKFLPEGARPPASAGIDDEEPDALIDGRIDLGAIASEFLTLALDPYPRKPGVAFEAPTYAADGAESPFGRLAKLSGEDEPD